LVALINGRVVGFCNYHRRRDGWHTIYELAVSKQWVGQKVGAGLLAAVPRPRQLKTTVDNDRAIAFYRQYLTETSKEKGKRRELVRFADE
jgi:ribosomal protein S18 acetylase RimI-like enzyme